MAAGVVTTLPGTTAPATVTLAPAATVPDAPIIANPMVVVSSSSPPIDISLICPAGAAGTGSTQAIRLSSRAEDLDLEPGPRPPRKFAGIMTDNSKKGLCGPYGKKWSTEPAEPQGRIRCGFPLLGGES